MNKRFTKKVVAVTGGAWGIGKNISVAFAREGATVIVCNHDKTRSDKTVDEMKSHRLSVEPLLVDLSTPQAASVMIQQIVKKWGRIDVLINNAKFSQRVGLLDETYETWQKTMSVSLDAAFFTSQEAVKYMKNKAGGSIIHISSVEGERIGYDSPAYHIAKAGLIQMTRYFAVHAGKYGVRTNCILPGMIIKDEYKERYDRDDNIKYRATVEYTHPLMKTGRSDDVANAAVFLASEDASFINGASLVVDGGLIIQEPCGMLVHRETS